MIPRLVCQACGGTIEPSDKFCSACGEKVEWHVAQSQVRESSQPTVPKPASPITGSRICAMCGNSNHSNASFCESCGGALPNSQNVRSPQARKSAAPQRGTPNAPLRFLQSWKLTLILAIVLIGVIVIPRTSHDSNPHAAAGFSTADQKIIQEIEALQKQVDANPKDSTATLRLANLLHDKGLFDRAIIMYDRYLEMNPTNADARVDMGTSYFEMSFVDSLHRDQHLVTAKHEITKALSYAPNHQLALFNLGIISFHSGDMDAGREYFKKCIAVDPNSESGKRAQQFLTQHSTNNPL